VPRIRVQSNNRITLPANVVNTLGLKPGNHIEVRFPDMPIPTDRGLGSATQWHHLSNQRMEDAVVLLASRKKRYNGAVYLGGYAVECALKSAICVLKNLPSLPESYRTHELEELLHATGLRLPVYLLTKFATINNWSVEKHVDS
jgi:HEPN domain-containing protein